MAKIDFSFLKMTKALWDAKYKAIAVDTNFYFVVNANPAAGEDPYELYIGDERITTETELAAAVTRIAANEDAIAILDGADTVEGSVRNLIKTAVTGLDGNVTGTGKFATLVSQEDGIVSAVMVDLTAADIPTLTLAKISDAGTAAAENVATSPIAEGSTDDGLVSAAQVATFVASEVADLEGAMHFAGVITREEGETDAQAIARVVTSPDSGDVVVMSDNAKEYIYDGTAWREVGDEGLYVQKSTTIAGVDLQDSITKSELLAALNVADGAQVNVLEGVQVNGTDLTIDSNKKVNLTAGVGSTDGSIEINGTDYVPKNLKSVATTGSASDVTYVKEDTTTESVNDALQRIDGVIGGSGTLAQKADKVTGATSGNFAGLDASGNLTDSGSKAADFATAAQGEKADSAIQGVKINGVELTPDANNKVDYAPKATDVEYQAASGGEPAVSVDDALDDIYAKVGSDSVANQISDAIGALDADVDASSSDAAVSAITGVDVVTGITEADGVITGVDSAKADKFGSAAAVLGTAQDTASDDTVFGAKAYADNLVAHSIFWEEVTE